MTKNGYRDRYMLYVYMYPNLAIGILLTCRGI